MNDPCELKQSPTTNEKDCVSAKESQPVAEPLKRYEILDLPKPNPVAKTPVPVPVAAQSPSVATSRRLTDGQAIMILLIAILVVAAFSAGAIVAFHAMKS